MVSIRDISFSYSKNAGAILSQVGFDIEQSQCIAILGNNGEGKSTLLKCIDRICPVKNGVVMVDGENVHTM